MSVTVTPVAASIPPHPTLRESLGVYLKIGLLSFGGPAGQIDLMHRELVERRRWISDSRFLHALNYCMLLPGPEAQQLSIYTGWLLHRRLGGVIAGTLFVLPGAFLMWAISLIYVLYGKLPLIDATFYGLKAAVMAIVAGAVLRIGRKVLKNRVMWGLAAVSFIAIFVCRVPFPLIVLSALGIGVYMGGRHPGILDFTPAAAASSGAATAGESAQPATGYVIADDGVARLSPASWGRTLLEVGVWTALWLAPVVGCALWLGADHRLTHEGWFFSKAALVTFGGAYAVLPYVAQQAVEVHGWLSAVQMIDGLGLAETTPGPLVLVLQFVGFLGGWNTPGGAPSWVMATVAAMLTTWVTFVPGFLFIFVGGPYIEYTRSNRQFRLALTAVTAAVVGVILNLAVWFGIHLVVPESGRYDWLPLVMAGLLFAAMQRWKWDVLTVVGAGAALGLLGYLTHLH